MNGWLWLLVALVLVALHAPIVFDLWRGWKTQPFRDCETTP